LRAALDYGLLVDLPAAPDPGAAAGAAAPLDVQPAGAAGRGLSGLEYVLPLAHDVASAMLHLHSENMLHGDLKVRPACGRRCRLSIEIGGFPLPCKYTLDMHD
jgi:hypothetical protein